MRLGSGRLAEGQDVLEQWEGELLEEILHLLIPELIAPIGARIEHRRQHALGAVLLAVEKGHKGFEGLRVVLVDDRIQPRADVERRVGRIADREETDHA